MIRILTTINQYYPITGGAENMARQLVERTNSSDCQNDVATFESKYMLDISNKSWLPACESITTPDGRSYLIHRVQQFRYMGKHRDGRIFRYYNLLKFFVKLISLRNKYDIFHAHTYYGTATASILAGLLLRIPVVVTGHSRIERLEQEISVGDEPNVLMSMLKHSSAYIAINNKIMDEAISIAGIPQNKVRLIHNGIDSSRFRMCLLMDKMKYRVKLGLPRDRSIIVFHGRLNPSKNLDMLIHGFNNAKLMDRAVVLLVGDGIDRIPLQELVSSLNLDMKILFVGSRDNVEEYLMASDIYCLPSPLEGFSLALLEAMSSGLICLASDIEGNRDAIKHGINGFLFDNNIEALAEMLDKALCLIGTPEGENLAIQARVDVETKFELTGMVHEYQKLFEELTNASLEKSRSNHT